LSELRNEGRLLLNYYDDPEGYQARGIDYDLVACLEYNPQDFKVEDIEKVLAVIEGEYDGADWHWLLQVKRGRPDRPYFETYYLTGGCDYTGWDCQSGATSFEIEVDVLSQLIDQARGEKAKTWREQKDREFGLVA
jgi:hypothetical protein